MEFNQSGLVRSEETMNPLLFPPGHFVSIKVPCKNKEWMWDVFVHPRLAQLV